jgi:TatD DNase family protein
MSAHPVHWIDSHCHFDFTQFDRDREAVWQRAQTAGVGELMIPGVTIVQCERLQAFCTSHPWYHAVGLHPYFLDQHQAEHLQRLEALVAAGDALAVGEIGLDRVLAQDHEQLEQQWFWFRQQVDLARRFHKPLILHVRGMHDEAAAWLRRCHFSHGGVVHAFTGSAQQARAWHKLGFALGIGGAMTHSRASRLRTTLSILPPEQLLLETDSPDMSPAFWTEPRNTPETLPIIATMVASVQNVAPDQLKETQASTFRRTFG